MKKIIIFFLSIFCLAIDIDIKSLEQNIQKNPNDLKNRIIIASYYIKNNNFAKAQKYINEVLKKEPQNKYALKLKKKIISIYTYNEIMKNYKDINTAFKKLYENAKYKKMLQFYKSIDILKEKNITDENKINIARVAMWEGKYDLSLKILSEIKNKKTLDYYEIKAYDLYYKGNYKRAKQYFQILFQTTGKTDYTQKLLDIYFFLGDIDSAQKLLLSLKRTHPQIANKYEQKIIQIKEKRLNELQKKYNANPTYEN